MKRCCLPESRVADAIVFYRHVQDSFLLVSFSGLLVVRCFCLWPGVATERNISFLIEIIGCRMSLSSIRQSILLEPGGPCNFPNLPVNASSMMKFVKQVAPLQCSKGGEDWAVCVVSQVIRVVSRVILSHQQEHTFTEVDVFNSIR